MLDMLTHHGNKYSNGSRSAGGRLGTVQIVEPTHDQARKCRLAYGAVSEYLILKDQRQLLFLQAPEPGIPDTAIKSR